MTTMLVAISIALALTISSSCTRQKERPIQVTFEVTAPFDGELIVYNQHGSSNPLVEDGKSLRVILDPERRNTYDLHRWPNVFQARGELANGETMETIPAEPGASYSLSVRA